MNFGILLHIIPFNRTPFTHYSHCGTTDETCQHKEQVDILSMCPANPFTLQVWHFLPDIILKTTGFPELVYLFHLVYVFFSSSSFGGVLTFS